jgi:predicted dehydrogenase
MTAEIKRVLFTGLGGVGQRHLRNVHAYLGDGVRLMAYRVRDLRQTLTPTLTVEKGVDFIERHGVEVYKELSAALEQEPDVVFVSNPTSMHMQVCIEAARAGCHLFIEKPLSHNEEGVDELVTLCAEKNLVTLVGFQLRFHPCYLHLKRLLAEGCVGAPLSVHAEVGEYLPNWHPYEDYRQSYASLPELGGGVVLSQIHEIDYLMDLFGVPENVVAFGGQLSHLEVDVEDVVDVLLTQRLGDRILPSTLHMDYAQRPSSRFCRIVGDEGTVRMDITNTLVTLDRAGGERAVFEFPSFERNHLFEREVAHFFECVSEQQPTQVPVEVGAASLRTALAIKRSLANGAVERVPG